MLARQNRLRGELVPYNVLALLAGVAQDPWPLTWLLRANLQTAPVFPPPTPLPATHPCSSHIFEYEHGC